MLKLISIVYFLLFILSFNLVKGQSYYYKNYTADNGLPSSEVFHVIQDKKGFIWIATNQGVSRFDGYEFTNFDTQSGLPRNTILEIFEDEIGRIWFISLTGELSWFENDSIHIYLYNDVILKKNSKNRSSPLKKSFYTDSLNNLYIGFNRNALVHISSEGQSSYVEERDGSNRQVIKAMPNNHVVFSSYYRSLDGVEIQFEKEENDIIIDQEFSFDIRFIACFIKDGYLFATKNRLFFLNKNGELSTFLFKNDILWISEDEDHNIWMGFMQGGVKMFFSGNLNDEKKEFLKSHSISSVLIDREKGCWVSTIEKGVYYFPLINIKNYTNSISIPFEKVHQVEKVGEKIWFIGNTNSLFEFSDTIKEKMPLNPEDKVDQYIFIKSIGDTLLYSFFGSSKYRSKAIYKSREIWSHMRPSKDIVINDKNSIIRSYKHINHNGNSKNMGRSYRSDRYSTIYSLLQISKNKILFGTNNGLFEFSLATEKIKSVDFSPLLRTRINHIVKDKNSDIIWIGTKGAGLLRVQGERVEQITMVDGLPGNSVNHIEQKDSILWLATNNGIAKVFLQKNGDFCFVKNSSSVLMETYTRANGLMNNEIYDIALNDGYVYAGTNNGLSYFKQELTGKNNIAPPVYFTEIKVMGKDTLIQDSYELNYDQNYLEFNFVGLSYQRENFLKYEYILEGVNSDWVETENRSVQFPMLPPGDYVFKVKAYNRSGVESEQVQQVSFKINKAYYQTVLFKIGIVFITLILLSLIFAYIFYVRMREVKKRDLVKDELNKFRQRALSAQMNPHFIYNSLNSVQSYILKNDREKSSTYLSKFGKLMRRILENSQNPVISLHEEIEALKIYIEMELARFRDSFKFYLTIDKDVEISKISVPPLIIQPYVENAIHHGLRMKKGEKNLWINIFRQEDNICIVIEDDGIGRKESQRIREHSNNRLKSFGTEITDKRLNLFKELYKNDVEIKIVDIEDLDNESKKGTRVEIYIKSLD
jgi:ligand-binding sensor domain-containing protein